jgi:hypothetical protein
MRDRRLLALLLGLFSVVTVTAQSGLDKNADSSSSAPASRDDSRVIRPLDSGTRRILTLEQSEAECYTLRTYRVMRDDPKSDTTRPAGYSTCQRATRFQLRTTVDSREINSK